jgi:hypothetical protein
MRFQSATGLLHVRRYERIEHCKCLMMWTQVEEKNCYLRMFPLVFYVSGPFAFPQQVSIVELWVLAFENWNANYHQKKLEWHGKRWNRRWSVLWRGSDADPILDIHVIMNTLTVVLLSSAVSLLPTHIRNFMYRAYRHTYSAYLAVERIVFRALSYLHTDNTRGLSCFLRALY